MPHHLTSLLRERALAPRLLAALAALACPGAASAAPSLERTWGTHFGDSGLEYTNDLAIDAAGNLYILGSTTSKQGIATPAAHQTQFGGQFDAYLAKFDPQGALVWATYFGGADQDIASGIAVGLDTVVITGNSRSPGGIATAGTLQPTHSGGLDDGFVAAFTLDGALKWGTYIGSSATSENTYAAAVDAQGSVYAAGYVAGAVPGLGTPGTHQPAYCGDECGYLAKFTPQGELAWGTYYGDLGETSLQSVSLNGLGELYVSGTAYDPSPVVASPGAHQTDYGGGLSDTFLVRFNLDGTRAWATYYGGDKQDMDTSVAALPQGGVVLSGYTLSKQNIATPGAHQTASDGDDAFVTRFDADGVRLWGTYYGYPWSQYIGKTTVDAGGAIYLAGQTNWSGGYGTPNGWLPVHQGQSDAYFAKLSSDGALLWGSYYGGSLYDGGVKVVVDADYRLYLLGGSSSTTGITTPGAYDETYGGGSFETFLVQFTQPIGAACAGPDDCGGGPCVDGVCCDSACGDGNEDCQVCNASAGATADGVCTPRAADVLCRPSAGTCDAAEFCSGSAGTCPDDVPAADGEPCDAGMCSAGACVPVAETTGGETTEGETGGTSSTGDTSGTSGAIDTSDTSDTSGATDTSGTSGAIDTSDTSDTSSTSDTSDTSDDPSDASSGDLPTEGGSGVTDDASTDTTGDTGSASGEPQQGDVGCGCRSGGGVDLLATPLLLLIGRRRRAAR